ncbi:hypothetical protein MAR_002426, partial [Mya arenaria]
MSKKAMDDGHFSDDSLGSDISADSLDEQGDIRLTQSLPADFFSVDKSMSDDSLGEKSDTDVMSKSESAASLLKGQRITNLSKLSKSDVCCHDITAETLSTVDSKSAYLSIISNGQIDIASEGTDSESEDSVDDYPPFKLEHELCQTRPAPAMTGKKFKPFSGLEISKLSVVSLPNIDIVDGTELCEINSEVQDIDLEHSTCDLVDIPKDIYADNGGKMEKGHKMEEGENLTISSQGNRKEINEPYSELVSGEKDHHNGEIENRNIRTIIDENHNMLGRETSITNAENVVEFTKSDEQFTKNADQNSFHLLGEKETMKEGVEQLEQVHNANDPEENAISVNDINEVLASAKNEKQTNVVAEVLAAEMVTMPINNEGKQETISLTPESYLIVDDDKDIEVLDVSHENMMSNSIINRVSVNIAEDMVKDSNETENDDVRDNQKTYNDSIEFVRDASYIHKPESNQNDSNPDLQNCFLDNTNVTTKAETNGSCKIPPSSQSTELVSSPLKETPNVVRGSEVTKCATEGEAVELLQIPTSSMSTELTSNPLIETPNIDMGNDVTNIATKGEAVEIFQIPPSSMSTELTSNPLIETPNIDMGNEVTNIATKGEVVEILQIPPSSMSTELTSNPLIETPNVHMGSEVTKMAKKGEAVEILQIRPSLLSTEEEGSTLIEAPNVDIRNKVTKIVQKGEAVEILQIPTSSLSTEEGSSTLIETHDVNIGSNDTNVTTESELLESLKIQPSSQSTELANRSLKETSDFNIGSEVTTVTTKDEAVEIFQIPTNSLSTELVSSPLKETSDFNIGSEVTTVTTKDEAVEIFQIPTNSLSTELVRSPLTETRDVAVGTSTEFLDDLDDFSESQASDDSFIDPHEELQVLQEALEKLPSKPPSGPQLSTARRATRQRVMLRQSQRG